jgi:hypothetical protein
MQAARIFLLTHALKSKLFNAGSSAEKLEFSADSRRFAAHRPLRPMFTDLRVNQ